MRAWVALLMGCLLVGSLSISANASEHEFRQGAEKMPFQAEVNRLMDIIIHSLYSNKDIFLRELISNAADAIDKVRFLSLTDKAALGTGPAADLPFEIKISIDKDNKVLSIRDTGIGMTKQDLINNLGTIASSGTAAFLEQVQKEGDLNMIGQFGVGFYSAYLVADYIELITKNVADKQYVWESKASGDFAISEDTTGEPLERGTQINLYLNDAALEYLEEGKIRELIQRYSEFISFPIKLLVTKEITKELPIEDDKPAADKESTTTDGVEIEEEEDENEEDKPKTKTVTETVKEWEVLNDSKALWLRPPGDVSQEEYEGFYKALTKREWETPLAHSHFRAEGDVDFKAVLYIPSAAPPGMYDNFYSIKSSLKLYVRRVFISDSFEDLLPKWLSFLVGLVDSDTMPLNVSREMLQLHEGIKVIKKKLVRKAIDMMNGLSKNEIKAQELLAEGGDGKKKGWFGLGDSGPSEEERKQILEDGKKYETLWREFGKAIKMGVIEDSSNRRRLMPLLRFATSSSGGNLTNLDAYISRMGENQKNIYYLVGTSIEDVESSPFVEAVVERGFEVIFFTDPIDEYMMGNINEYEEKTFANVSKEDLKLDGELSDDDKTRDKRAQAYYSGMTKWWKNTIEDPTIMAVKVSRRLTSTPCVVVAGKYGMSATMERIARAQALGDDRRAAMRGQRTLEINPKHPLIKEMRAKWEQDESDAANKAAAKLLYATCLMDSGFILDDYKSFNSGVQSLLRKEMGVDDSAVIGEDEYPPTPEELKKKSSSEEEKDGESQQHTEL